MPTIRHDAFKYFFYFMQERMNMFHRRYRNDYSLSEDPILAKHKFTNVYRACDRVSQYLIAEIIRPAEKAANELDLILNIIVFKVFNSVGTWEYLKEHDVVITQKRFDAEKISALLTERIHRAPVFNGAYIMTATGRKYEHLQYKHARWLSMIQNEMIKGKKLALIAKSKSMAEVYRHLRECTFIGDFLAYQYAVDINYSEATDFDENSFVKAGVGAIRGIKKCFASLGAHSYEDAIRQTQDQLEIYREKYGYSFENLFGREPQLIDLQNCFCETDKYLRVKMPELNIGNTRIKQKYTASKSPIQYVFPRKWNLKPSPKHEISK